MSIYPRERISEALQDSANRGIAMLIAPAGFGKSEAGADAFGSDVNWIDIPLDCGSVEGFARLIIHAAAPRAVRALNPLLSRPSSEENRAHLMEWCASRLRAADQPIILDDFQHLCSDQAAIKFVRGIVEATVPNLRWVIISRETPELPIGTWLARDYMTLPVTAEDLAFEVLEGAAVATAMGVDIEEDSIEELVTDVGGWPLAVRLSLASWERTRSLPPLRIRTRAVLFDFIEGEVWSDLTELEQQFFEAAANLVELRPRILGAAGFPESRLTLERLHRRLPLLSRAGSGNFRLHELFREFILERSKADHDSHVLLTKRLARALERFGDIDDAIGMYLRAEVYDAALELLTRYGVDRIQNGHRAEITSALGRFPKRFRDHPVIAGLRGYALAGDGSYDVASREIRAALTGHLDAKLRSELSLQLAITAFNAGRPAEAIPILQGMMVDENVEPNLRLNAAATLSSACAIAGEPELARDAVGFCSIGLDSGSVEIRALVRHRLAFTHLYLGEAAVAESYATESVQLANSIGHDALAARAYSVLHAAAVALYPDTTLSRRYAEACLVAGMTAGDKTMQMYALEELLIVAADQGDDDLFESSEHRLIELGAAEDLRNMIWMRFFKAVREAGRGNPSLAASALTTMKTERLSPPEQLLHSAMLALVEMGTNREKALALMSRPALVAADKGFESQRALVFAQVYSALALWLAGRGRAARRARMPDLSSMPPRQAALLTVIATICSTSRQTTTAHQLAQLTEPLLALGLDGHARFLRTVLAPAAITQLTRTELEVLRALRHGGTTNDVADRLGRSSHTVLSHLKSACSKIGCSGRAAAVAYAVDMGWIE